MNPGMNTGMNPMMPNVNSYSNLNIMDPYQPPMAPMGQMNPNISIQNPMVPPVPASSYQT